MALHTHNNKEETHNRGIVATKKRVRHLVPASRTPAWIGTPRHGSALVGMHYDESERGAKEVPLRGGVWGTVRRNSARLTM